MVTPTEIKKTRPISKILFFIVTGIAISSLYLYAFQPLTLLKQNLTVHSAPMGKAIANILPLNNFNISYSGQPDRTQAPMSAQVQYISTRTTFVSFKLELLAVIATIRENGIDVINIRAQGTHYAFIYENLQGDPEKDTIFTMALSHLENFSSLSGTMKTEVTTKNKQYATGKREITIRSAYMIGNLYSSASLPAIMQDTLQYFHNPSLFDKTTYILIVSLDDPHNQQLTVPLYVLEDATNYAASPQ
jgi:hypothetical protein